jgi:sugar phosphate isomerase/epimerase
MQNFLNHNKFALQLWSLKDEMAQAPERTIEQVASFGYAQIETFEGEQGICWGMAPAAFKTMVNGLGMEIVSAHCDVFTDFERKVEAAVEAGLQYLVCPWLGPNASLGFYQQAAERFNLCGELCQKAGIGFAYHNHDYSFLPVEGRLPIELLMQETDPALVQFEMDIFWVVVAGHDPVEWLQKAPARWPLLHLKDRAVRPAGSPPESTLLGQGDIDFAGILGRLEHPPAYFIVEQEQFAGTTPLAAAQANARYMRGGGV